MRLPNNWRRGCCNSSAVSSFYLLLCVKSGSLVYNNLPLCYFQSPQTKVVLLRAVFSGCHDVTCNDKSLPFCVSCSFFFFLPPFTSDPPRRDNVATTPPPEDTDADARSPHRATQKPFIPFRGSFITCALSSN